MYKVSQIALEEGYSEFLSTKMGENDMQSVTEWVEESLIKENPNIDAPRKIAFYNAEKSLIKKYIVENKFDKLYTLIKAIDNEKFDNELKDHINYRKFKANECRVLADAIIDSKRYLEQDDNTMHKNLSELLDKKCQTLKNIYDVNQVNTIINTIDTAFQIVHYEKYSVSTMGATSDTADHH
jgi:hypothetical protein